MGMNWLGVILSVTALVVPPLLAPMNSAGAAQQAQDPQQPIRIQVNLVNLFATVRDKRTKQIVPNLEQAGFKITEDNVEQKISFFARESSLPITLGLLMDTSGSEQYMLAAEQDAASRFLSTVMRPHDLAMVMSFDSNADLLADFTEDRGILDRAIHRARVNVPIAQGPLPSSQAGTVFYDAIYLACHEKLAEEAGRKALVILTDAQDTGSRVSLQDAIEAAQRTDTVVHVLLVGDRNYFGINEGVAKKLSEETGGRTVVVSNEKRLQEAFQQISEELRTQYTLGYYSTNTARDGAYRKIKVETTQKNLDVLTRRGYYAPNN